MKGYELNKYLILSIAILLTSLDSYTQGELINYYKAPSDYNIYEESSDSDDEGLCATELHHTYLMNSDSEYRRRYLHNMSLLEHALKSKSQDRIYLPPQYTIPVVVHVIHLGEPVGTGSNISDAQITGAITGLNQRYANSNNQGVNIEIDFCLATQDPNGCPTTGIVRVNGSNVPNYTSSGIEFNDNCGAEEVAVKDLSKWSTLDYYNIWVVHDICGNWSGYAYYPNGGPYDGAVIDRNSMTSTSWTLAHELGHGLNLRHTFNGDNDGNSCPPNNNCTTDGDFICDTPPHKRGDCGSTNPCTTQGIWNNSRYNWMSYCSSLNSVGRFTSDQKTRMRAAMEVFPRLELQSSVGCDVPPAPQITSSSAPMCTGTTRSLTGSPTGGTFSIQSGPGTLNGNILTATGSGTIVVKYTTCSGNSTQSITSFQTPSPTITSSSAPMCSGSTRTLTGTPTGGTWSVVSGPGSINGNILTATGAGTIVIQYAVTQNGCTGNATQNIVSNQTPNPSITSSNAPMCSGDTRTLTATPAGGTFSVLSGPGTINGNILTATGSGTIMIQYLVTQNGCTGSTTQNITANQTPSPSITSSNAPMCSGDTRTLTASPAGGAFSIISGPGTINGNILTATGGGTIQINYALTQNGCTGNASQSITSFQTPAPVFTSSGDPICSGQTRTLTATPTGGTFSLVSGPATLIGNTLTSTGSGTIVIQYTVIQNGCSGSTTQQITSNLTPNPQITSDDSPICSGENRILSATPTGGNFDVISGPGEINGNILTSTGQGTIEIEYYIEINGCSGSTTQSIISFLTPEPEITSDNDPMCSGETRVLTAFPTGGAFDILAGPGVLNGNTLTATGDGIILIQYELTQNGCTGQTTQNIEAFETPDPEITSSNTPMCSGNTRVLSAVPGGGTWDVLSGPGIINGNILTSTGAGTIIIEYYVSQNDCEASTTQQIFSSLTPDPEITSDNTPMCEGETRILSASPAGGDFEVISGPGDISGNTLTSMGAGMIRILYSFTQNNCSGTTIQDILSFAIPEPEITSDTDPICSGDSRILVAIPSGGTFTLISGPGEINGNILTCEGEGTITIEYELTLNGCTGSTVESILAFETPSPVITSENSFMCEGDTRMLQGDPAGGNFSILSGPGSINGNNLTSNGEGLITIEYTLSENGCTGTDIQQIPSYAIPEPLISSSNAEMCSGETKMLTGNPDGGVFTLLSGPGNINGSELTSTGAGLITIEYTLVQNGCTGLTTQTIQSKATPEPVITSDTSPMCFDDTRELTGLPSGGIFEIISGPGVLNGNILSPNGTGIILIHYSVTENGCTGIITQEIGVSGGELPVITSVGDPLCAGVGRLLEGMPVGGAFTILSGPGDITNGQLIATGQGMILIEYRTCGGATTQEITAVSAPEPLFISPGSDMCEGEVRALSASIPGGLFQLVSGPGVVNGAELLATGDGEIVIRYTVTENGCSGWAEQHILSHPITEIGIAEIESGILQADQEQGAFQWVDCGNGFQLLEGQQANTLVVTQTGSYAVIFTQYNCADTSSCLFVEITSTESTEGKDAIRIYPNPTSSILFIEGYTEFENPVVLITDLLGKRMTRSYQIDNVHPYFDLSGLPSGMYFLILDLGRGRQYKFRISKM